MDIQAIHANLSRYVDLPLEEVEVMLGQMEEIKVFICIANSPRHLLDKVLDLFNFSIMFIIRISTFKNGRRQMVRPFVGQ